MKNVLKKYWEYDSFRPLQEDVITSVIGNHDTLALMPTGGGKSITFQVAGLMLGGLTIVVTPLISLMKDQTDNLRRRHIEAVFFHSGMTFKEQRHAWERIVNNKAKFLYIAPERLGNETFMADIRNLPVNLIVVDEAHCISQWGYDFRPSYLKISKLRKEFENAPVLALTATATPDVAKDICRQLQFREDFKFFKMSFSRKNISYLVRRPEAKLSEILQILRKTEGCGIIYVRSRKKTKEIAEYLSNAGISATNYHAGLDYEEKENRQNLWHKDKVRIMVATNAFGMGIDKPDVRLVIHYDLPPSLEEYYQEAGRAGRDGKPSYAVLLASKVDQANLRRRLTLAYPERKVIKNIYTRACVFMHKAIGEGYGSINEFDIEKFCEVYKLNRETVKSSMKILGQAGYLEFSEEHENSSRLMIIMEREELYNYKFPNQRTEKVLVSIMRRYPGLFTDYVFINERKIAEMNSQNENDIYETLLELSRIKVIHYVPRKRSPYIYMPTSMEEEKYIEIGKSIYENRKEIEKARIERIIDYAFSDSECRVRRMLDYFGEENKTDCLTCDVCRAKRKQTDANERIKERYLKLAELLGANPNGLTLPMLRLHFPNDFSETLQLLRRMAAEGEVELADNIWYPKNRG